MYAGYIKSSGEADHDHLISVGVIIKLAIFALKTKLCTWAASKYKVNDIASLRNHVLDLIDL